MLHAYIIQAVSIGKSKLGFQFLVRFRSITKQYFRRADGVVVMFDLSSWSSYTNVKGWMLNVEVSTVSVKIVSVPKQNFSFKCKYPMYTSDFDSFDLLLEIHLTREFEHKTQYNLKNPSFCGRKELSLIALSWCWEIKRIW